MVQTTASSSATTSSGLASAWQRFEQMPRGQLEKTLIVIGILIVVYAVLWQILLAAGFG